MKGLKKVSITACLVFCAVLVMNSAAMSATITTEAYYDYSGHENVGNSGFTQNVLFTDFAIDLYSFESVTVEAEYWSVSYLGEKWTMTADGNSITLPGSAGGAFWQTATLNITPSGEFSIVFSESTSGNDKMTLEYIKVTATGSDTSSPVPVPAAVWLFGSGLVGIVGIRRKKAAKR